MCCYPLNAHLSFAPPEPHWNLSHIGLRQHTTDTLKSMGNSTIESSTVDLERRMTFASKIKDTLLYSHPYYPPALDLPGWQPAVLPYERILGIFFSIAALIAIVSLVYACETSRHLDFLQHFGNEAFQYTVR